MGVGLLYVLGESYPLALTGAGSDPVSKPLSDIVAITYIGWHVFCILPVPPASLETMRAGGKEMNRFKLSGTEIFETSGVFEFSDGPVSISERETHEFYRRDNGKGARLIVGAAIDRTREFISRTRAEFSELNAVMRELTAK